MTDDELLMSLYDKNIKQFVKDNEGEFHICIKLDDTFLRICRDRIIEGKKKYGDDWHYKDCLKELEAEKYDIINYLILNACQEDYHNSVK
jgi:hypothetical protein